MKNKIDLVIKAMKMLSKKLKKPAQKLTYLDLRAAGISERSLLQLGGLPLIKSKHFPLTGKDFAHIQELKADKKYLNKLEKELGENQLTDRKILELLKEVVVPLNIPKAEIKKGKVNLQRDVVAMLNDTHFGLIVDPEEIGRTNAYNWKVACRRTAMFARQIADYKIEKRHEVRALHLVLNGDLLQGLIHDTKSKNQELLGIQQNGTIHILSYLIGYVSQFYSKVIVYCNHGNHDDNVLRREGGRIISHKSKDSFLTPIYYALSLAFSNTKNVEFELSKGLFVDLHLPAGRAGASHGDTLFTGQLGNPGSSLNVKSLSDAINRWNTGELEKGNKKVQLWMFGHTHTYAEFKTFDGVRVIIAPSLSGIDPYAHSLSINSNQIGQMIFESTPKHICGDVRLIDLVEADKDASLDQIIPTYEGELGHKKRKTGR